MYMPTLHAEYYTDIQYIYNYIVKVCDMLYARLKLDMSLIWCDEILKYTHCFGNFDFGVLRRPFCHDLWAFYEDRLGFSNVSNCLSLLCCIRILIHFYWFLYSYLFLNNFGKVMSVHFYLYIEYIYIYSYSESIRKLTACMCNPNKRPGR